MDKNQLEEYKKLLEERRRELIKKIGGEEHEDFGSDVDMDEKADEAESLGEKVAIDYGLRELISEIDSALNRIRKAKYGICENCGKEIEKEVLRVSPESKFCRDCKKIE